MIIGIGVDLIEVARVEKVYAARGERFVDHVLHREEMPEFKASKQKGRLLAKRFAVKEAATKALGTGQAQNVLLRHFYITHNEHGKPQLHADAEAHALCDELGINAMHVSISDENEYATAYVVLERH